MPRYYFHVSDSSGELLDEEGRELPGLEDVHLLAIRSARSLICADVMGGRLDLEGQINVTDASERVILVVTYRYAAGLADE